MIFSIFHYILGAVWLCQNEAEIFAKIGGQEGGGGKRKKITLRMIKISEVITCVKECLTRGTRGPKGLDYLSPLFLYRFSGQINQLHSYCLKLTVVVMMTTRIEQV